MGAPQHRGIAIAFPYLLRHLLWQRIISFTCIKGSAAMDIAVNVTDWPLVVAAKIDRISQHGAAPARLLYDRLGRADALQQARALGIAQVWGALAARYGLRHLWLAQHNWAGIASAHGDLVVQGPADMNLGLLFAALGDVPLAPAPAPTPDPVFADPAQAAIWQIVARLTRSHAARRLCFDLAGKKVLIDTCEGRFDFIAGAKDLPAFLAKVRKAAQAGSAISYTLEDPVIHEAGHYSLTDVISALGATQGEGWRIGQTGWPLSCPAAPTLTDLRALSGAALACATIAQGGTVKLRGYGAGGSVLLTATFDAQSGFSIAQP